MGSVDDSPSDEVIVMVPWVHVQDHLPAAGVVPVTHTRTAEFV